MTLDLVDRVTAARAPTASMLPLRLIQAVALAFFAAKIALLVVMQPYMDETYYFLWGQHPSLSYFDHPSLIGWTQGLSSAIFGWNMAGLREPVFLSLCGDLFVLYLFARRLGGTAWHEYFWLSAALFLTMPIMLAVTGVAIPDHLLVVFCLAGVYLLYAFLEEMDARRPSWRLLYGGAAMVGLATLSKYYGVLIGIAFVAALLIVPRYRALFRSVHLYAAAALAVALQAPVLLWNLQKGFASFGFVTAGRVGVTPWWQFSGTAGYLTGLVAVVSPFLVWPFLRFAFARKTSLMRFPQALAWLSTLLFLLASTVTGIIVHWNALAYVVAIPFLAQFIRSRALLGFHFVYATLVLGLFALNYAIVPLGALFGFADQATGWGYGWDLVAARVAVLRRDNPAAFLAATDYTLTGELGFATRDKDVTSLSLGTDAFDFWPDPVVSAGRPAIIVTDGWRPLYPEVRARFASVREVARVDTARLGHPIDHYTIYLGEGFGPVP